VKNTNKKPNKKNPNQKFQITTFDINIYIYIFFCCCYYLIHRGAPQKKSEEEKRKEKKRKKKWERQLDSEWRNETGQKYR